MLSGLVREAPAASSEVWRFSSEELEDFQKRKKSLNNMIKGWGRVG